MKFSIIIPVYNVEQYLCECVDSVLNQTYQDMEIILVDDGSTDCSGKICDQYSERYQAKVKVIHNANQGQLMARSCGIKSATGDVFLIIDADDYIRLDTLELLNSQFEKTTCDMVLFNASQVKDFAKPFPDFSFENGQRFSGETKKALYKIMITTSKLNPLWLKAIRREVAEAIDEDYKNWGLKNAGDLLYSLPTLSAAQDIVYLDQTLYYYRSRQASIVHSYNPERHRSIKIVHMEMEKYIDKWDMAEYHPAHYAREVRGWVECLKKLLANTTRPDRQLLVELAEDDYFRNAYDKMAPGVLARSDAMLGKWLYGKKYGRILLTGMMYRTARAAKRLARGNGSL